MLLVHDFPFYVQLTERSDDPLERHYMLKSALPNDK